MKMSEYLKKRKLFFIVTSIIIIVIIISSILVYNKKNKETSKVQEQDLSITYNITKEQVPPMDKTNGVTNAPLSTIKIKNNKNYKQKYILIIKSESDSSLELNKIYIYINEDVKLLSDYTDGIILTDTVDANKENVLSFKTWIASDLIDANDQDKTVNLKYEIKKQD